MLEKRTCLSHVEALAPATSANLGAGFDVFGVALDALYDKVSVDITDEKEGIKLYIEGKGASSISTDPEKNTAGVVAKALLKSFNIKCGLVLKIEKGIKPGSGLGSSAASAAATATALNQALGLKLSYSELIKFAALGEIASAGAPHADNVSSSIMGFFTVVISNDPLEVLQIQLPYNVKFVIAVPELTLSTSIARSVIPKNVKLSDSIFNIANASAFIIGAMTGNIALMGRTMNDRIAEPYRASLIPGLNNVKRKALEAGALGVTISGAGPSILALVNSEDGVERNVAEAMREGFKENGLESDVIITKPGPGAKIVKGEK
jgi:homoserine kinase